MNVARHEFRIGDLVVPKRETTSRHLDMKGVYMILGAMSMDHDETIFKLFLLGNWRDCSDLVKCLHYIVRTEYDDHLTMGHTIGLYFDKIEVFPRT